MMNYIMLDEKHIQMEFGIMGEVKSYHKFPTGELESVNLGDKNMVVTHVGELIPAYTQTPRRKNKASIEFHKNGVIKGVYLEEQTEVDTPIGTLPVEYLTFYDTGELHRVFVSDGQLSGFWTEEEEREYAIPLSFDFGFTKFTARLNGLCFYKSGAIRSVTLYPGETIEVETPAGKVETSVGFALYESGALKSVEPKEAILIDTPIGLFSAIDPDAIGVNADVNSIRFDEKGRLISFKTIDHRILVSTGESKFHIFTPQITVHPLFDDRKIRLPMTITFDFELDRVQICAEETQLFSMETDKFTVNQLPQDGPGCSPVDCATCSICNS